MGMQLKVFYTSEADLQHHILLGGYPLFYYGYHTLAVIYKKVLGSRKTE
jgi:hypothetical protein